MNKFANLYIKQNVSGKSLLNAKLTKNLCLFISIIVSESCLMQNHAKNYLVFTKIDFNNFIYLYKSQKLIIKIW